MAGNTPMTSCIGAMEEPLIITPGVGKYKKGYEQPLMFIENKGIRQLMTLLQFYVLAMVSMMIIFKLI